MLQVDAPPVIQTLGNPAKKSLIPLTVTGTLADGITLVKGSDCRITPSLFLSVPCGTDRRNAYSHGH
jgi:hypothetical protein